MPRPQIGKGISLKSPGKATSTFLFACLVLIFLASCVRADSTSGMRPTVLSPYYSTLDLSAPGNIRGSLKNIVSKHKTISNRKIWEFLVESEQSKSIPGSIRLFYSRRLVKNHERASGEFQSEPDYWNREHIWPQSFGLKKTRARKDLHNIVAVDRTINSSRGNKAFALGGQKHLECTECKTDRDSWEPPDEVKGDVARMVFYMVLRYDGNDDSGTADLDFAGERPVTTKNHFGNPSVLFDWHCNDPVSAYERRRNDLIHQFQGNRNPFIDQPEWVRILGSLANTECDSMVVSAE